MWLLACPLLICVLFIVSAVIGYIDERNRIRRQSNVKHDMQNVKK